MRGEGIYDPLGEVRWVAHQDDVRENLSGPSSIIGNSAFLSGRPNAGIDNP
ncbi:MAG TPA: hypothetical protein VI756_09785 [Blastocatellia bacterium]